MTKYRLVSD